MFAWRLATMGRPSPQDAANMRRSFFYGAALLALGPLALAPYAERRPHMFNGSHFNDRHAEAPVALTALADTLVRSARVLRTVPAPSAHVGAAAGRVDFVLPALNSTVVAGLLQDFHRRQVRRTKRGRHAGGVHISWRRLEADGIAVPATAEPTTPDGKMAPKGRHAAGAPVYDDSGRFQANAVAGTFLGHPAAALNFTLADGPVHVETAGITDVSNLADPSSVRKLFKISTRASIPFELGSGPSW